ncbi:MAG: DUF1223 domain-containing protein [Polyangiaceae bacterium]
MRPLFPLLLALPIALGACSRREERRPTELQSAPALTPESPSTVGAGAAAAGAPAAVVELFTSEGCSSCPAADENLARIAAAARKHETRVFALSFHVDYWNYIGWADPFSDASYSERQRSYARRLGSGVYTPQMVVNGSDQMLGSSEGDADAAIERALAAPMSHALKVSARNGRSYEVTVTGPATDVVVQLAVVQGARDVRVTRGENRGRTLSHANVVRALVGERTSVPATIVLEPQLPRTVDAQQSAAVVWVADAKSGRVLGAEATGILARTD